MSKDRLRDWLIEETRACEEQEETDECEAISMASANHESFGKPRLTQVKMNNRI